MVVFGHNLLWFIEGFGVNLAIQKIYNFPFPNKIFNRFNSGFFLQYFEKY